MTVWQLAPASFGYAMRGRGRQRGIRRGPDGVDGQGFTHVPGALPGPQSPRLPVHRDVIETLDIWSTVTRPGRILAVIDVSGSMNQPVPGTGTSREQIAIFAAKTGLNRLDNAWAVGLWVFSTRLNDTVLAAYKAAQAERDPTDPRRATTVVILTDGINDDTSGGLTIEGLKSELRQIADSNRPVDLFLLGIPDANEHELGQIASAAGGTWHRVDDPADVDDIFLMAIAQRLER